MHVVEMPPEEFAQVVNSILEGRMNNPFKEWESVSQVDVARFEKLCSHCLDGPPRSHLHGQVIA